MAKPITDIEGIGPSYAEKLKGAGVNNIESLLETGASKKGRVQLAADSSIDESRILTWVNMADLMRINGVGSEFSELLQASGVDTVKELRNRNAENLKAKLDEVNAEKKLTRAVPALSQVEKFITEAKGLDPVVTH
ncbi:MAG: hypothetical protein Kapaf2KO_01530 [Candidatus Kapaibacteriales bacterium]